MSIDCSLHEVRDRNSWNLHRILEREEDSRPCTLLRRHCKKILTEKLDCSCRHCKLRLSGQHCRKSTLAGAVRAHDRMDLTLTDRQIHTLQDFLILNRSPEALYFQ